MMTVSASESSLPGKEKVLDGLRGDIAFLSGAYVGRAAPLDRQIDRLEMPVARAGLGQSDIRLRDAGHLRFSKAVLLC